MTEGFRSARRPKLGNAGRVAAGIFTSRVFGVVREITTSFFLGVGPHLDVFRIAFRAPNIVQVLLGEQALSAAVIPIYSRLLSEGRKEDARRFAGASFGLLAATASSIALLGILFARPLVTITAPGFLGDASKVNQGLLTIDRFESVVMAVRILFPMTAFFSFSAWTLSILNSHRRFFLSYVSPVLWNSALIGAVLFTGWDYLPFVAGNPGEATGITTSVQNRVLVASFWGGLFGGVLQFLVQLPVALRELGGLRLSLSRRVTGMSEALGNFFPMVAARGATQLSGYVDMVLASFISVGALSALGQAQVIYLMPISLFAVSVAAAELPELSRRSHLEEGEVGRRVSQALRRIAFLIVPSQVGFLGLGLLIVGALFRRGEFLLADNWLVYLVLAAYALGLLFNGWSRLVSNVFFAEGNTKTPARFSIQRVLLSAVLGGVLMLVFDRFAVSDFPGVGEVGAKGDGLHLGAVGLALGSAVGAVYEWLRLRQAIRVSEPSVAWPARLAVGSYGRALIALLAALAGWWGLDSLWRPLVAVLVFGIYGATYLLLAKLQGVPEVDEIWRRVRSQR